MSDLLQASRPFSWINTALPFFAVAWSVHHGLSLAVALGVIYFLGPYNLLVYGVNDLYDYESDRLNPRKGGSIEGGLIAPARAGRLCLALAVSNVPLLVVLAVMGGPAVGVALAVTACVALIYSVPPFRTKVIPGLDSATSSLHFVLPAVCGGIVAGSSLSGLPWRPLVAFFLWGMAAQALGAIQDVEYDRSAGIGSIAVGLGARRTALFSLFLYAAAVVLLALGAGPMLVAAVALLPYVLLAASCLTSDPERQARRAWRSFLLLNLLTGFVITQILLHVWGAGHTTVLALLAWGSAAGVVAVLMNTLANERALRRRAPRPDRRPDIAVIVPVRNEAQTVGACLAGLTSQDYPGPYRVVVVDDGSTDSTVEVARAALRPQDSLLQPGPAPGSWTGKCWAAQRGVDSASAELLVFLDADTVLGPDALSAVAAELTDEGGMVSLLTRYRMDGPAERIFMPAFAHMQVCFLPIAAKDRARHPHPALAYGYGPCMGVTRDAYERSGGHAAIRNSNREDIDLARAVEAAGYRARFRRGADLASTRHYRNVSEIAGCWRRTFYAYGGNSLAVALLGMAGIATVFLLPLVLPVVALLQGDRSALAGSLSGLCALIVLRMLLAWRERQPFVTILAHPLTWTGTLIFQALGVADGLRGLPPRWRGRTLPAGGAP